MDRNTNKECFFLLCILFTFEYVVMRFIIRKLIVIKHETI